MVLATLTTACAPAREEGPFDYVPPAELRDQTANIAGTSGDKEESPLRNLAFAISLNPDSQSMRVEWSYWDDPADTTLTATSEATLPLGFYPTAITPGDDFGIVYLGGTDHRGRTRVVRYALSLPFHDGLSLQPATLAESDLLLELPANHAQRDIAHLTRNRGWDGEALLIEFWNTHEVHNLDVTSGKLSLQASPTPVPGAVHVADLQQPHDAIVAHRHTDHGYLYYLSAIFVESPTTATAILCDTDEDGVLDRVLHASRSNLSSLGLDDPSKFLE